MYTMFVNSRFQLMMNLFHFQKKNYHNDDKFKMNIRWDNVVAPIYNNTVRPWLILFNIGS